MLTTRARLGVSGRRLFFISMLFHRIQRCAILWLVFVVQSIRVQAGLALFCVLSVLCAIGRAGAGRGWGGVALARFKFGPILFYFLNVAFVSHTGHKVSTANHVSLNLPMKLTLPCRCLYEGCIDETQSHSLCSVHMHVVSTTTTCT